MGRGDTIISQGTEGDAVPGVIVATEDCAVTPVGGTKDVALLVAAWGTDLMLSAPTTLHPHASQGWVEGQLGFVLNVDIGIFGRMLQNGLYRPF